ncbi:unknown [Bacillus sp. CAG:988]|nr:unknown [Bacillus sp. CAG:988]
MSVLEVRDIHKNYGKKEVLKGCDISDRFFRNSRINR